MPELPEVETIRIQINAVLPLKVKEEKRSPQITSLLRKVKSPEFFKTPGLWLKSARRHGKVLILDFYNDQDEPIGVILSGLGMSGGWRIARQEIQEKHTHLQWCAETAQGQRVYLGYVDPRRFGSLGFLDIQTAEQTLAKLGVDVASPDYSPRYLEQIFKRHGERQLKPFLLEQRYFAGIGNYIACEICAYAGLRPTRRLKTLSKADCSKIVEATHTVLQGTGSSGGLTFSGGYKDTSGNDGGGLDHLVVFHQKLCRLCGKTPVKKIELAARGTFYCPNCQR